MQTGTTTCWICGEPADSAEHLIKVSDLKSVFGKPHKKNPLFFNSSTVRNKPLYGLKADILRSTAKLCAQCNNQRTQQHDFAWQELSEALRGMYSPITPGVTVRLNRIFKHDTCAQMLNVHLFFVKQFGCRICADSVPLDISDFSKSILEQKANPNLFLTFGHTNWRIEGKNLTGMSEIQGQELKGKCKAAAFFYHINDLAVNVSYIENQKAHDVFPNSWHPAYRRNRITFNNFLRKDGLPESP